MGIKNLYQVISEHAPAAIKTGEIKNQFGRKVAIVSPPRLSRLLPADMSRMRKDTRGIDFLLRC